MNEHQNPWKVLSEKLVYKNNWISLTEFNVINPNGGEGIYGKVHFNNIAVGALPMDDKQNTYLVGQYRFPLNAFSWEIPEGGCSSSEDPVEAAKRELLEETGLVAQHWKTVLVMHLSNSVSDEYAILYLARDLQQRSPMPEETEKLVVKKLPFEEAYQMVEQGLITDAMSVATIQKVKLMLLNGQL